jgi:hypothetical protein
MIGSTMPASRPAARGARALDEIRIAELSDPQLRNWLRITIGLEPYRKEPRSRGKDSI